MNERKRTTDIKTKSEESMATNSDRILPRFESISQLDVPKGRDGKHKQIVSMILEDLDRLKDGSALKLPPGRFA